MGQGVVLPRRLSQKRKDIWLLCIRSDKKVLPMRKRYPQNRWTFKRACHASISRDALHSHSDLRSGDGSRC